MTEKPTAEEIQRSYDASMDSVALLKAGKPESMDDAEWEDCVSRNVAHLKIQLEKGAEFYGDLDITPFKDAVK